MTSQSQLFIIQHRMGYLLLRLRSGLYNKPIPAHGVFQGSRLTTVTRRFVLPDSTSAFCSSLSRFVLCIVLAALSFSSPCAGQGTLQGFTHHMWRIGDGLPDQNIQAIAHSKDGFLWLGTPHGLLRFDGYRFVDYGAEVVPALHEFGVSSLLAASDGSLWVGSFGGGLIHFDGSAARVYGKESGFVTLVIRVIFEDAQRNVWIGTDHGIYEYTAGKVTRIAEFRNQIITAIAPDGRRGIWFGGKHLFYRDTQGVFSEVLLPPDNNPQRIRTMVTDAAGTLWMGTLYGLFTRSARGVFARISGIRSDVSTLHWDEHGRLWIGTIGKGLLVRDLTGRLADAFEDDPLSSKVVLTFANDASGDFWVGTQSGLSRFSQTGIDFERLTAPKSTQSESLFIDSDHSIWLSGGTVLRLARGIQKEVRLPALKNLPVRAAFRDAENALWVGTAGQGAFRFNRGGGVTQYSAELGAGFVTGFLGAPNGTVWIATDSGIAKWTTGSITSFQNAPGAPHMSVLAMALAPQNDLWVGTSRGIDLLHDGQFLRNPLTEALGRRRIWSMYARPNGYLWIGTEAGLYVWTGDRLIQVPLPPSDSSISAVISIITDARDRILIARPSQVIRLNSQALEAAVAATAATATGVASLSPVDAPETFSIAAETGAELYGGLPATAAADADGGAWYATHLGFLHIEPPQISRTDPAPPIVIDRVAVDGIPVSTLKEITLQPSARNLEIQATPILLSSQNGLRLRRRLLGFEDKWTEFSPGATSIYSKLPPGTYTFRVEALWPISGNRSSSDIMIVQEASFWRKPWFLTLFVVLLGGLIWLFHRYQIHEMSLRFQAVMEERTRVAREIHDTILQGCIGVSSVLEGAASVLDQQFAGQSSARETGRGAMLDYARDQIKATIREARSAIWNLRSTAEEQTIEEDLRDLIERLTATTTLKAVCSQVGAPLSLVSRVQHEVVMAAREAILNALTHAKPAKLLVKIENTQSVLSVEISDDGVGFNSENHSVDTERFGLLSMRERMEVVGGTLSIDSFPDRGTRVSLRLPLSDVIIKNISKRGRV